MAGGQGDKVISEEITLSLLGRTQDVISTRAVSRRNLAGLVVLHKSYAFVFLPAVNVDPVHPTSVGNAVVTYNSNNITAVHPHVCGECGHTPARLAKWIGSPPRVWGMLN